MVSGCLILSVSRLQTLQKEAALTFTVPGYFSQIAGQGRMDASHLSQAGSQARKHTIALLLKIHSHEDENSSTLFGQKVSTCPRARTEVKIPQKWVSGPCCARRSVPSPGRGQRPRSFRKFLGSPSPSGLPPTIFGGTLGVTGDPPVGHCPQDHIFLRHRQLVSAPLPAGRAQLHKQVRQHRGTHCNTKQCWLTQLLSDHF